MSEDEFVFAPIHETHVEERGEELHLATVTPACDFCLDMRVVWEYPCERFVIEEIQFGSDDNWLACERCAEYIEQGFLPALRLRSLRSWIKRNGMPDREQIDGVGLIQQGFFDHCNGERFHYES